MPQTQPATAERITALALAGLLAAGFALAMAALVSAGGQKRLGPALTPASLLDGGVTDAIDQVAAHELPIDGLLRALGGVWRWRVFGSGGPQVWVGRNDWLYFIDELRPWPDAERVMRLRADLVGRIGERLGRGGIDLIVLLVPDKARIVPSSLIGPRSAQAAERYPAFLALLRERHVPVVALAAIFAAAPATEPLFYRTDTHWNQTGAALAARAVAEWVRTPIDHSHHFRTTPSATEMAGPGDLLRLMSLDRVPDGWPIRLRPRPDREHREVTAEIDPPVPTGGLLDEPAGPDVSLIGSSFSRNANFAGRLQEALGTPVVNFAEVGGGFAGAAKSYFASVAFRETPPRLVIWEIPERFVGQPMDADDMALNQAFPIALDASK